MDTRVQAVCPECDAVDDVWNFMREGYPIMSGNILVHFKCPKCKADLGTCEVADGDGD